MISGALDSNNKKKYMDRIMIKLHCYAITRTIPDPDMEVSNFLQQIRVSLKSVRPSQTLLYFCH